MGGGPCRGSYTSFPISKRLARCGPSIATTVAGTEGSGGVVLTSSVRMLEAFALATMASKRSTPREPGGKASAASTWAMVEWKESLASGENACCRQSQKLPMLPPG